MTVAMEDVLGYLDREEPPYREAARLGEGAIPHLISLIRGGDVRRAARAASLAGIIGGAEALAALELAAHHPEPVVRVAAAATAKNLATIPTSLAIALLGDSDPGVRKWALTAVDATSVAGVKRKLEEIAANDPVPLLRERAEHIARRGP